MRSRSIVLGLTSMLTSGAVVLVACTRPSPPASAPAKLDASHAPSPASANPEAALAALDTRVPLPLLPHMALHQKENMRAHLLAVQDIALAGARNDFPAVAEAASKLGLTGGMERMCQHMGRGAPGFTEQALAFHRSADDIVTAAHRRDLPAVMSALGTTLQHCTGCHATFRQKIVDDLPPK